MGPSGQIVGNPFGIRSTPFKPQFGQPLPPRREVTAQPSGGVGTTAPTSVPASSGPTVPGYGSAAGGLSPGPSYEERLAAEQKRLAERAAAPAVPGGGGLPDVAGGTGAPSAAMQGLGAALEGIEDPMSALSMPAGLREGLGRRQYPTLANALAGLRY